MLHPFQLEEQAMNASSASASSSASSSISSQGGTSYSSGGGGSSYQQQQKQQRMTIPILLAASSMFGFVAGRYSMIPDDDEHKHEHRQNRQVLPNGLPRTCCETTQPTPEQIDLLKKLKNIVGRANVLVETTATATTATTEHNSTTEMVPYIKGARIGYGSALCIVKPTKIKQLVDIVQAVVDANCVVLVQGRNTGLTGGSVPRTQADGRPTVIVSTQALDTIFPIDNGERVVCLAGVGLASLQQFVQDHFPDRESHSILGSTFLNPTTAAGIAFGSGGTQLRKGPAFTERALYLKVVPDKFGKATVQIVNTLGIQGFDMEEGTFDGHTRYDGIVRTLDAYVMAIKSSGTVNAMTMKQSNTTYGTQPASDADYKRRLCNNCHCHQDDAKTHVNRYNADTRGCDCNRSEGKVLILASVHDTFPKPTNSKTFWISFEDFDTALEFRRRVCLNNPKDLPISMEYLDRDSFDVIDRSGRVLGNTIKAVGTSSPLVRNLWNLKLWIESLNIRGASTIGDRFLYFVNPILPSILPTHIMKLGKEKDHHVAMTVGDFDGSLDRFLERMEQFQKNNQEKITVHECKTGTEQNSLTAFRFVAAPAFRTYCVGNHVQGISVDYALPGNGGQIPMLPSDDGAAFPLKRMRYSHFGCNVVHEDIAFPVGIDVESIKMAFKTSVEEHCHGKLPAEHGHGTEYHAPEQTQKRWMKMDPLNVMNPGVGGLPSSYRYETN